MSDLTGRSKPCPTAKKSPIGDSTAGSSRPSQYIRSTSDRP